MQKMYWLAVFSMIVFAAKAQTSNVIKIAGTKFAFDIMQQWINAYSKTHEGVQFQLSKAIPPDSADLMIAAHAFRPGELNSNQIVVALNRYAQLPIVNSERTDLQTLQQKGFTQASLKDIYFNQNTKKDASDFTGALNVYRRDKNVCASRSFAENVTGSQLDVAGTLVNGDDRALSAAVKKDVNGISYNNVGHIYNLQTRKVMDSIAIIPIDLNENGRIDADENFYTSLDNVLNYLSSSPKKQIPQENVNIVFDKTTIGKEALEFIQWIITEGQTYNRSYGFLNLEKAIVLNKQESINSLMKVRALARRN